MEIEYRPSLGIEEYFRSEEWRSFRARHLESLGRPRKAVHIADDSAELQLDRPGALSAFLILVELAAGPLRNMEWEAVQEGPPGDWWGDLEPGSPTFDMQLKGERIQLPDGFRYRAPPFEFGQSPPIEPGARLMVDIERAHEEDPLVRVWANAPGFLSLAKHSVYLAGADVSIGTRLVYAGPSVLEEGSNRLVLVRQEFDPASPWAAPPTVTR